MLLWNYQKNYNEESMSELLNSCITLGYNVKSKFKDFYVLLL